MAKLEKFDTARFGLVVEKHAKNFEQIQEMYKKKLIGDNHRLFTLEDVIEISFEVFKGGWFNCSLQQNPKSKWSNEMRPTQARKIIKGTF